MDHVGNIILWNYTNTTRTNTNLINSFHIDSKIELPAYIEDDLTSGWLIGQVYMLSQILINPQGKVDAHYEHCPNPDPQVVRTHISSLVSIKRILGFGTVPGFTFANTNSPQLLSPIGVDTIAFVPNLSGLETVGYQAEPACICDIRALTSHGHEPGCGWKSWRDSLK